MNKVLLVSPLPPSIGGIASWTVDYMNQMPSFGCDVALVNTAVMGKRLENNKKINLFDELSRMLKIKKEIKQALKDKEIKVLHYNASCYTKGLVRDYLVLKTFFKRVRVVYHCHCNLETNVNNSVAKLFFGKIAKGAGKILVLNTYSFEIAKKYTDNVETVPNFINKLNREKANASDRLENIAFVARICEGKGIYELLEAAKIACDVNFHIIGPDETGLLNGIEQENVIIHGAKSHEKVMEMLKDMDALVLPSYSEGFPLVVMEAMAAGLPIIATPVGSIPDMIGDGGGVLVKLKDGTSIAEAVEKIKDKDIRQSMSQYNLEKVKNEYLSTSVLKRLLKIYEGFV